MPTQRASDLADEALKLAGIGGDDWVLARATYAHARVAGSARELRDRVDDAAALLRDLGNLSLLVSLLSAAAYVALTLNADDDAAHYVRLAQPLAGQLDDPITSMYLHGNAGLASLFGGDTNGARVSFCEQLRLCRKFAVMPATEPLLGLAAVAALDGNLTRAARLCGAAQAHRYGMPLDALDARRDLIFDQARNRQGDANWDAECEAGASASLDDLMQYALETNS